jgi:hypothetical protein
MTIERNCRTCVLCAVASAVLLACGGGGGDESTNVVRPASLSALQAQQLAGRVAGLFGVGAATTQLSQSLVAAYSPNRSGDTRFGCSISGSLTQQQIDADNNLRISTGDTLGMVADNCTQAVGGQAVTLSGSINMQVLDASVSAPYSSGAWNLRTRQNYGAFTVVTGATTLTMSGAVEVVDRAEAHQYTFFGLTTSSANAENSTTLKSGGLSIQTTTTQGVSSLAVGFSDLALQTGVAGIGTVNVAISTASGSTLKLNAQGEVTSGFLALQLDGIKVVLTVTAANQVRLDVDNGSDGTIDATQTIGWQALLAAGSL